LKLQPRFVFWPDDFASGHRIRSLGLMVVAADACMYRLASQPVSQNPRGFAGRFQSGQMTAVGKDVQGGIGNSEVNFPRGGRRGQRVAVANAI
jgi:hypothetical protein